MQGVILAAAACHPLWDSERATFSACAVAFVAFVPALVIAVIGLKYMLSHPYLHRWRPVWTQSFVTEAIAPTECTTNPPKQPCGKAVAIFLLAVIVFATGLARIVAFPLFLGFIALTVAWGLTALVIASKRPVVAPTSLLVFYILALLTEFSVFDAGFSPNLLAWAAHHATIWASLISIVIVLVMPIRNPILSKDGIGIVGETPSGSLRSPEDQLLLWQYLTVSWMSPLISLGRKRRINEDDVWLLGYEFQHRRLHEKFRRLKGSVLGRLLQANGVDVAIIGSIAIVQMICNFSSPLLLQQLLKVMSGEHVDKKVALTYATMMLVLRIVFAQSQVLSLWYGRRCYERSRGEMVMMVYEKALSRKNTFGQKIQNEKATEGTAQNGHSNVAPNTPGKKSRNQCGLIPWRKSKAQEEEVKQTASMGKIFNLLRGDVYEVAQRFWEIDTFIDKPIGLIISIALVWKLFGPSCFLGVLTVIVAQVINGFITRSLLRWERNRRSATDVRLQITSQFVEALRHLRWYGWQGHWLRQVMEARDKELHLRVITSLWNVAIRFVNVFSSAVFPVVALYGYTILAGRPLSIDIIFPALQLFTMLEERLRDIPTLITTLINASIAMGRIEDFMAEPDKEMGERNTLLDPNPIRLESCSFSWPGKVTPVLSDVTITVTKGLTVVCGVVGAGKTALLQALLGELDRLKGESHIPNEMVGYCAQTPWLQSMSIRDNILFSSPYDEQRYKRVLDACALVPDLANFTHGDLSFIGENGIGLSGGQKARVALARAVYSSSRILFLDDPLSALDHNTAEYIVRKCFLGPLVQDRIVVLVTHRTTLVQPHADQIVEITNGYVKCYDKDTISSAHVIDDEPQSEDAGQETAEEEVSAAVPDKFIEEEHRADWGVQSRVYWSYVKAGKLKWWSILVAVLAIYRLAAVVQSWFLKEWGEAYSLSLVMVMFTGLQKQVTENWVLSTPLEAVNHTSNNTSAQNWPLDRIHMPHPAEDVRPWLGLYLGIATFQALAMLVAQLLMLVIIYCAGKTMFKQVMERVSHATFRFFDVTPVGRLMNRLTSDIGAIDGNISIQFQIIAFQIITWTSAIVVIASVTPMFLVFALLLTGAFVFIFLKYLPLSQSLRRLEMVSLSPLLSNFGELLHGLTTVRAFHAEIRFQNRVIQVVDKFQGMDHFYWSLQSWLMYRFESLSGVSTFCLTALALYTDVSAGLVAFLLVSASSFVDSTHALCKYYGQLQMDFVSVERVDELRHIETEPEGEIDPPAYWPRFGTPIIFENVTIRYAPHLDPSLSNISIEIPGGSTAAVIGRTGSGKSTLALCLLGVIQPESGEILIDNIDISKVSKQALRTRVTFVAQDPVLFPGSIRLNLDPTKEFSDQECADALNRICARHGWDLDFHIEAGGRNLSQGQRQLIGLTRAALRRSPIVILDEATASIDHETSLEIQKIIREEMKESTVITIAHRLEAINDADYYVVLDKGKVEREGRV